MAMSDLRRSDLQPAGCSCKLQQRDRRVSLTTGDSTLSDHGRFAGPTYRAVRSFDSKEQMPGVCFNPGTYSLRGCFRLWYTEPVAADCWIAG
jgi:hypothetical protein